jgi:hypothetical protein
MSVLVLVLQSEEEVSVAAVASACVWARLWLSVLESVFVSLSAWLLLYLLALE